MRRRSRGGLCVVALGIGLAVAAAAAWTLAGHGTAPGSAMVYRAPSAGPHHRDFTLRREGSRVVLIDDRTGRVVSSHGAGGISAITIDGADGPVDNTLTVDLSGGPIDATRGISWDGGVGGYNTLDVKGGGSALVHNQVHGPHSGVYRVGSSRIAYSHIAPITDSVAGPFTYNAPLGMTAIIVTAPTATSLKITCVGGSGSCGESITITNKTSVLIQTVSALDPTDETWVLDAPTASTGLTSLTFHGGSGANKLVVDAYPTGIPLTTSGISTVTPVPESLAATEGVPLTNVPVGLFTDSNPTVGVSSYTATFDWGDGTAIAGTVTSLGVSQPGGSGTPYDASFAVTASHTYADQGSYGTRLSVAGTDGSTVTLAGAATVGDASLSAGGPVAITGTEGTALAGPVGSFTDANPTAPVSDFSVVITWGDGSVSAGTVTQPGGPGTVFEVAGTHRYAEEGSYTLTVSVTDRGGSTVTLTGAATVGDASLSAGSPVAITGTEGTALAGPVGSFTDANPTAPVSDFSVVITWGDGSVSAGTVTQPGGPGTAFEVAGTHAYGANGTFIISVGVHDVGGSNAVLTATATVATAGATSSIAATPDGAGYWAAAPDGGVFFYGDAHFYGSMGGRPLGAPIVGIAATPDGRGYWLVASDGGVFAFGDASFDGSMGSRPLAAPIVGIAATPDGRGYWLVASDGGVFAFGDASFDGSMGSRPLGAPIVGIAATPDGRGYWLVASDGGVFAFGDASFDGSMGSRPLGAPIVGIAATPDGRGYWLVASDGGVFAFGDASFDGSMGGAAAPGSVVGLIIAPGGTDYSVVFADGIVASFGP